MPIPVEDASAGFDAITRVLMEKKKMAMDAQNAQASQDRAEAHDQAVTDRELAVRKLIGEQELDRMDRMQTNQAALETAKIDAAGRAKINENKDLYAQGLTHGRNTLLTEYQMEKAITDPKIWTPKYALEKYRDIVDSLPSRFPKASDLQLQGMQDGFLQSIRGEIMPAVAQGVADTLQGKGNRTNDALNRLAPPNPNITVNQLQSTQARQMGEGKGAANQALLQKILSSRPASDSTGAALGSVVGGAARSIGDVYRDAWYKMNPSAAPGNQGIPQQIMDFIQALKSPQPQQ